MRARRVLLLRAPDEPGPDRYVEALARAGFEAACAPVLDFAYLDDAPLRDALAHADRYAGLILTSPRAAEALQRAGLGDAGRGRAGVEEGWARVPTFAVGDATAEAAEALGLGAVGRDAGDAEALADLVLGHAAARDGRPLLFVCGTRRRDALPEALRRGGVAVDEVAAYETRLLAPPPEPGAFGWAVWFSPSGVEAVFGDASADAGAWNSVRRAAIGPTTAAALAAAGCPADAVAARPTPDALAAALDAAPGAG